MPPGNYFDFVKPTYLENWPSALSALSLRQTSVALSAAEVHVLGRLNGVHAHRFARLDDKVRHELKCKLDGIFEAFPKGAFVRLGSRSAKDTPLGILTGCRCADGESALRLLTDGSARLAFDLGLAVHAGYAPHVFAREWLDIEPWMELRCFMHQRKLVGIGQYHYQNTEAGQIIDSRREAVLAAVTHFFAGFDTVCHLNTAVCDLVLRADEKRLRPVLLEINPWVPSTDFGLFDGNNDADFDGSLRCANRPTR